MNRKTIGTLLGCGAIIGLAACDTAPPPPAPGADAQGHGAATALTAERNAAVAEALPLDDPQDLEDASRGLIARADSLEVRHADGRTVWNQDAYGFLSDEPPASANPSLWRQARLNALHGLYEVADGIYQLRGFDLANMTLIRGETGWIIVDPLTVTETAARAMAFAREHLPDRPVVAVLFTHSHVDHFGGVEGVLAGESGVDIIAPVGFMEEAVSENVMAGVAMQRRAGYMYGRYLARSVRGHIGTGLGKEPPLAGSIGIREPTQIIDRTGQTLTIDGVEFEFQNAPGSEAPAEFTFYLRRWKAFCGGEVVSRNIHNVYTLRGAKVRDALAWSDYIQEAIDLFAERSDIYFGTHQWPLWGQARIAEFMRQQRDVYKYIHDQSLRLANSGLTPNEIAEEIRLPESLQRSFANRGYYGTVKHNAKAVYQRYFGWYDGNPANLDPLPPVAAGERYVAAMGGAPAVLALAETAFADGEYRWVAQLLNHLVFAEPDNAAARGLLARTFDQLGYQAESGPWRDVYLSAAFELRHGLPERGVDLADAIDLLREIPLRKFFDSMAARLNGPKAEGVELRINFRFTDRDVNHRLHIENAVLHHRQAPPDPEANASLALTHELFLQLATNQVGLLDLLKSDELELSGSRVDLIRFFRLFDKPDGRFAIVTP